MRREFWIIGGLVLGLGLLSVRNGARGALTTKMSGTMPAWTMTDLSGRTVRSTDFKGRVVVLNFWATWCPPCRAEIPDFVEFAGSNDTNRLVILGASVDADDPAKVRAFAESRKINYPILFAGPSITELFGGVASIPTTFIVDTNGNFTTRNLGAMTRKDLERLVKPLLP